MLAVQIRNLRCFTTSFSLLSPLEGTLSKSALRELSNHRETLCLLIGCTRLCFIHIKIKGWPWTSQELHSVPLRIRSRHWVQLYENSVQRRKAVHTFIPHSVIPPCSTGRTKRGQREHRMNGTAYVHLTQVPVQTGRTYMSRTGVLAAAGGESDGKRTQVKGTRTLRFKSKLGKSASCLFYLSTTKKTVPWCVSVPGL